MLCLLKKEDVMRKWFIFIRERIPFAVLMLTGGGLALTSQALARVSWQTSHAAGATLLGMLFLLTLRIMDEIKDFETDKVAHPERPLPRGLLTVAEAQRGVGLGLGTMLAASLVIAALGFIRAGLFYALTSGYLWLMYREFYCDRWLQQRVFLYAVTHQLILLLLALALASVGAPSASTPWLEQLATGVPILGAFFTFEVCRKLDPGAHPLLKTYRARYGTTGTFLLVALTTAVALAGYHFFKEQLEWAYVPLVTLALLVPLTYLLFIHKNHKLIEGAATLALLGALWLPPLAYYFF
jgi:4-hydroxybenzoate polyprenyltransferase